MVYKAGDKGEKLYVIHTGKVKVSRFTESGKEQVLRVLGPGEFIGELSYLALSLCRIMVSHREDQYVYYRWS